MHIWSAIGTMGRLPGGDQSWAVDFIFRGDMKLCKNWDFWGLSTDNAGPRHSHTVKNGTRDWAPGRLNAWMPFWTSLWAGSINEDRIVATSILRPRENFVIPGFHISYWTLSYCTWWTQPNTHRSGRELAGRVCWFNFVWFLMRLPGVPICYVVG